MSKSSIKERSPKLTLDRVYGISKSPIYGQLSFISDCYELTRYDSGFARYDSSQEYKQVNALKSIKLITNFIAKEQKHLVIGQFNTNQAAIIQIIKLSDESIRIINTQKKGQLKQISISPQGKQIGWIMISQAVLFLGVYNTQKKAISVISPIKNSVEKMSFQGSREKPNHIFLMTHNSLRPWRIASSDKIKQAHIVIVPLSIQTKYKFIDHCWAFQNKQNILLILAEMNQKTKSVIGIYNQAVSFNVKLDPRLPSHINNIEYSSIIPTKRSGFILGGKGVVSLFYMQKGLAINNQNLISGTKQRVISMSISNNQEIITYGTVDSRNMFMNNYLFSCYQNLFQANHSQLLFVKGTHASQVTSLSFAPVKNIFASISTDRTLRIWDYSITDQFKNRCSLVHTTPNQISAVSIYPSGQFVGIAYRLGFKVFAITKQRLVTVKQVHLAFCIFFEYSNKGHYFIVNDNQNLLLYDSIDFNLLAIYSFPYNIKKFALSDDDLCMVVQTSQGFVYQSKVVIDKLNVKFIIPKQMIAHRQLQGYKCFAIDQRQIDTNIFERQMVGCTSKKYLVIYSQNYNKLVTQFPIIDCTGEEIKIISSKGFILLATSHHKIRIYSFPFIQSKFQLQYLSSSIARFKLPQPLTEKFIGYNQISSLDYKENVILIGKNDGHIIACYLNYQSKYKDSSVQQDRRRIKKNLSNMHYIKTSLFDQKNNKIKRLREQLIVSQQKLNYMKQKLYQSYRLRQIDLNQQGKVKLEKIKSSLIRFRFDMYWKLTKITNQIRDEQKRSEGIINILVKNNDDRQKLQQRLFKRIQDEIEQIKQDYTILQQKLRKAIQKRLLNQLKIKKKQNKRKLIQYHQINYQDQSITDQYIHHMDQYDQDYQQQLLAQIKSLSLAQSNRKQQESTIQLQKQSIQNNIKNITNKNMSLKQTVNNCLKYQNQLRLKIISSDSALMKTKHHMLQRQKSLHQKEQNLSKLTHQHRSLSILKNRISDKRSFLNEVYKQKQCSIKQQQTTSQQITHQIKLCQKQINIYQRTSLQSDKKTQALLQNAKSSANNTSRIYRQINQITHQLAAFQQHSYQSIVRIIKNFLQGIRMQKAALNIDNIGCNQRQQIMKQKMYLKQKKQSIRKLTKQMSEIKQDQIIEIFNKNIRMLKQLNRLSRSKKSLSQQIDNRQKRIKKYLKQKKNQEYDYQKIRLMAQQNQKKLNQQKQKIDKITSLILQVAGKQIHPPFLIQKK